MTQHNLGLKVNLSADRIRQYECGYRTPKTELLKDLATALGCSPLALADPVVSNRYGAMYALFEMEKYHGLNVYCEGGRLVLQFGDGETGMLNYYLREWEKVRRIYEEQTKYAGADKGRNRAYESYNEWKFSFSSISADQQLKVLRKQRIEEALAFFNKELEMIIEDLAGQKGNTTVLSTRLI
jgi:transcriptional regulator with XRE-family HTH domain